MKIQSSRCLLFPAVAVVAGCVAEVAPPPDEELGSHADAMFARNIHDSSSSRIVPPFTAASFEHHSLYGRTVGASNAFAQCVANTMADSYMNINDPNAWLSRSLQIALAWQAFRHSYVTLEHGLRPSSDAPNAAASAHVGSPTDHGTKEITYYDGYRADNPEWSWLYDDEPWYPWHWRAGTVIHEFMHAQGYRHADATCSDDDKHPVTGLDVSSCSIHSECSWTTYCGGSGTPPASMTYGTAGDSIREFTAVKNGREDTEYYLNGEPSAPYIYGKCASTVVSYSGSVCGLATEGCPTGKLKLIDSWTGEAGDAQASTTCVCVQDPRHVISLRSFSGWNWTATSGGGSGIETDWAKGWGAWQTFYAIESGGPDGWTSGESMAVKAFDGEFLSNSFQASLDTPNSVKFVLASGASGTIGNGSIVNVWDSTSSGTGQAWAYNNGTAITTTPLLGSSSNHDFIVAEPRYHLVYLEGPHGSFVNIDPSGYFYNKRSRQVLEYGTAIDPVTNPSGHLISLDPAMVGLQNQAAFWLVDYDGGEVDDGDVVSFQVFKDDSWHFLSTFGSTGHAKQKNIAYTDERFTINKITAGGSVVNHGDTITLLNAGTGTYLVAMPADYFDAQIRAYGTFEGAWTKFNLHFVHSFDLDRTAKW